MRATQTLPENYKLAGELDLSNNLRAMVLMNIAGGILFIGVAWLFIRISSSLRPEDTARMLSGSLEGLNWLLPLLGILVLTVAMVVLHEAVHGLCFWIFSGAKPKFAFRGAYAYAALPGWYLPRGSYLITALAPLVVLSLLSVLLLVFVPPSWMVWVLAFAIFNAAGAVGDLYVAIWLLFMPRETLAMDAGDRFSLYAPEK